MSYLAASSAKLPSIDICLCEKYIYNAFTDQSLNFSIVISHKLSMFLRLPLRNRLSLFILFKERPLKWIHMFAARMIFYNKLKKGKPSGNKA